MQSALMRRAPRPWAAHSARWGPLSRPAARHCSGSACWNCGASGGADIFFCGECGRIQDAPKASNFFELFKLPTAFDVDVKALDAEYRRLQSKLHPDRFVRAAHGEMERAEACSSLVSTAHTVLKSPTLRAQHLLEQHGMDALSEAAGSDNVDPSLLMHVMEAREEIEEAVAAGSQTALMELHGRHQQTLDNASATVGKAFAEGRLRDAQRATVELQYAAKIVDEIHEHMESV